VDNNYLDLGMNKSGFVHTLPSGRLNSHPKQLTQKVEKLFVMTYYHFLFVVYDK
jgi:hypothetical protein